MKLSLVVVSVGLAVVSAACSHDRPDGDRTTTITSTPLDPPQNVATAAESNVGVTPPMSSAVPSMAPLPAELPVAPAPTTPAAVAAPVAKPSAPATTAAPATTTTATPAPSTSAAHPKATRSTRRDDLLERGQLTGPSLAPPAQPIVVYSGADNRGSSYGTASGMVAPESPSDFSPKPRMVAPTSTGGQITSFVGAPFGGSNRGFLP